MTYKEEKDVNPGVLHDSKIYRLRDAPGEDKNAVATPIFENLVEKKLLAQRLGISVSYIDKLMTQGFPYYKLGRAVRFRYSEVMEWLQKRRFP